MKKTCKQIVASSLHNGCTANTNKGLAVISGCANSVRQRPICSFITNKKTK